MCGRYATARTSDDLVDAFGANLADEFVEPEPDWNVAPTKTAPIVIGREEGTRELLIAKWGLVPSWAKDPSIGNRMINARAETVMEKPAFKKAFAQRRAVIPVDGYYEWYTSTEPGAKKQPFYMSAHDGSVLGLAGLYEFWKQPDDAWLITYTILTTTAPDDSGRVHDRAPLLVTDLGAWLAPEPLDPDVLLGGLTPAAPGVLAAWPVSTAVNSVRNNGPELIAPLPLE